MPLPSYLPSDLMNTRYRPRNLKLLYWSSHLLHLMTMPFRRAGQMLWCAVTAFITALKIQHAAKAHMVPGHAVEPYLARAVGMVNTVVHTATTVTSPPPSV